MTRQLTINLADILERKYPHGFHVPVDVDISSFLEFADDDWDHSIDLNAILAADNEVALVWTIDDVHQRRPDLTEEQAWKVLVTARDDFLKDACHLDFIESTANGLFPKPEDIVQKLRDHVTGLLQELDRDGPVGSTNILLAEVCRHYLQQLNERTKPC